MATEQQVPDPPWVAYPGEQPWWGGWRQGAGEAWLHHRWLPFWQALDASGRQAYLIRWPPPNEAWREYMTFHWSSGGTNGP